MGDSKATKQLVKIKPKISVFIPEVSGTQMLENVTNYKEPVGDPQTNKPSLFGAMYKATQANPKAALAYDAINTAAYFFPPTVPLAYGMTALQATGAADNMHTDGTNVTNTLDVVSALPGFGLTGKLAKGSSKQLLKKVGTKSEKYIKRANNWLPKKDVFNTTTPSLFQRSVVPKFSQKGAYLPYTLPILGEDVLNNIGNIIQLKNDL